jgi:hypothetical protein
MADLQERESMWQRFLTWLTVPRGRCTTCGDDAPPTKRLCDRC